MKIIGRGQPKTGRAACGNADDSIFMLASGGTAWLIVGRVQPEQKKMGVRQVARSATAGLLLVSWLFTAALAASPSLHQYFHHDAGSAEHSCAVTLFTHGKITPASVPSVLAVFVLLFLFCLPLLPAAGFSAVDLRLGFGRAPPHFFGLR